MLIRTPYNYDRDDVSMRTGQGEFDNLTHQEFKDETDINFLLERFNVTGQLTVAARAPQYGDFSSSMDFHEAMNQVVAAKSAFADLPAKIRNRFHNDPAEMIDFLNQPENQAEAKALGLVEGKPSGLLDVTGLGDTNVQEGTA